VKHFVYAFDRDIAKL